MTNAINHLIEIVFDPKKKKLRARSIQDGRWVRFPNKLRKLNAIYQASKMTHDARDFWIAGGTITPFIIDKNKNPELETILNLKNKGLLKQFYEVIIAPNSQKVNTEMMNILFLIKKIFPKIDEQLLQPLIKPYHHSAFISSDLLVQLQNMLSRYNERRVVNLFTHYREDDFLEDTVVMYERLFNNDLEVNELLPDSPKNIRELHTLFWRECAKIKTPKNTLHQNLPHLQGQKIGEFEISVPETSHDLINIGNTLSICVGNGHYAEKVLKKQCQILTLKKNGKYVYCIEYSRGEILQGRGFANCDMPATLKREFLATMKASPKSLAASA